jgi:2-oxoglutarate dehydrogenase E2 component (dihydrolipoamide succinyltransferase)
MAEVTMPKLGESVTEGTITRWCKQLGEQVALDEALFEVSTDKVDSEIPSPVAGRLSEIRAEVGAVVRVGEVVAVVVDATAPEPDPRPDREPEPEPEPEPRPDARPEPPAVPAGRPAVLASPVVRRLLREHGIDAGEVAGTGVGGRISRSDAEAAVDRAPRVAPTVESAAPVAAVAPAEQPGTPTAGALPFNSLRRRTAEHMVRSKATSPHAVTVVEVDYTGVERARRATGATFKADEGFSLTYLPFIARAVVDALADYPHLNASVGDDELLVHEQVNLSIAVDLAFEGLVAPVVRGAGDMRLRALARAIHDLATRARAGRLTPDDVAGGTFTLSNSGSYGTHLVLPIINQPQVAVLSTDAVRRRPVVVETADGDEAIAIRSVGLLAMSWDHRAFDGAYAAAFLAEVRRVLETRDWSGEL